jgi:hypothetical protein
MMLGRTPQEFQLEFFENNQMKTAPHAPHSSDIIPSDFSLFGHVKGRLTGRSFVDAQELFDAVRGILGSIAK